ncbi:hypothetical protein [Anaerostipes sp.]|uniref:hypothetical protein n=1 Tax=Anaerostipes sp. TaxID=1872530 RepID=UPI0025C124AD|nr:hypothetical protein [Anaerostipes sp.]MBS7008285.1 hypothetical protein [Anaerostipes sp.]
MNTLTGIIFLGLYILIEAGPVISVFLLILSLNGFVLAFLNGIPMHFNRAGNDSFHAVSLGENPEVLRSFWIQLKINEQTSHGIRLKDMPEEWFAVPSDEEMQNSMTAALGVSAAGRK